MPRWRLFVDQARKRWRALCRAGTRARRLPRKPKPGAAVQEFEKQCAQIEDEFIDVLISDVPCKAVADRIGNAIRQSDYECAGRLADDFHAQYLLGMEMWADAEIALHQRRTLEAFKPTVEN